MNWLDRYLLTWIAKRVVNQGGHKSRITHYYKILAEAARKEFTEENRPTLEGFLNDCHKDALREALRSERNREKP